MLLGSWLAFAPSYHVVSCRWIANQGVVVCPCCVSWLVRTPGRIVVILFMMPLSLLVNTIFALNNSFNFWYSHYFGTGPEEHARRVQKVGCRTPSFAFSANDLPCYGSSRPASAQQLRVMKRSVRCLPTRTGIDQDVLTWCVRTCQALCGSALEREGACFTLCLWISPVLLAEHEERAPKAHVVLPICWSRALAQKSMPPLLWFFACAGPKRHQGVD